MPNEPKHPITPKDLFHMSGRYFQVKKDISGLTCPSCGGIMKYKWTTGTYKGTSKTALIYAQCTVNEDNDHGYGPKSSHCDASYKLANWEKTVKPELEIPPTHNNSLEVINQIITKPEEKTVPTKTPDTSDSPLAALENWLGAKIEKRMQIVEETVKTMVEKGSMVKVLEIKTDVETIKVEFARHPVLDEMLERWARGERTFLLVGPRGTGKTTIAEQFMQAIGAIRYSVIPLSEDKRAAEFIGYKGVNVQTGEAPYVHTSLVEDLCESLNAVTGTILEEIDASNANVLLTLNTLTNGYLCTPDAAMGICPRGKDHAIVATANTFGTNGSLMYCGRNQLDGATLDRYRTLFVDYCEDLERSIVQNDKIATMSTTIRERVNALKLKRAWGLRDQIRLKQDLAMSFNKGKTLKEVCTVLLKNQGWNVDEASRVL